jgi:hypothetical protein
MAEAVGTMHTRGSELLRGRWWPIEPELVSYQMAAQVPEIMDGCLYCCTALSASGSSIKPIRIRFSERSNAFRTLNIIY